MKPVQFKLRLPPALHHALRDIAERRGCSVNAEIVDRLLRSMEIKPRYRVKAVMNET